MLADSESHTKMDHDPLSLVSSDSTLNGFLLVAHDIYPFSPVIKADFNLPETSAVSLFFTDSLEMDTGWIINSDTLPPGLYRVPYDQFLNYGKSTGSRIFLFHLSASSIYGRSSGAPVWSTYTAVRTLAWR